jgi:hypothetical protein
MIYIYLKYEFLLIYFSYMITTDKLNYNYYITIKTTVPINSKQSKLYLSL